MQICEINKCTGCMACMVSCPTKAISVGVDKKGFYVPCVDENTCINCGKCQKICPSNHQPEKSHNEPTVYAAWNKDEGIRKSSTSGGIFTNIASLVIRKGGSVCGVSMDNDNIARHIMTENMEDIAKLRMSKYVQSSTENIYSSVKKKLDSGGIVLFTGTPCQVGGLKKYLGKDYEQLITMDIVCHGVPSPKAFSDYLSGIEKKNKSRVVSVKFRYKKPGWTNFSMKIDFENGRTYCQECHKDPYLAAFLSDYLTRDCCHDCQYTSVERVSDITAADFWSYVSHSKEQRNNEKGISLVLVNTEKGKKVFDEIKSDYFCYERTIDEAKRGNRCLSRPYMPAKNKDDFWNDYLQTGDFFKSVKRFCPKKKKSLKHSISEELNRNYYLLPSFLKRKVDNLVRNKK